jgi:hypothetical protein
MNQICIHMNHTFAKMVFSLFLKRSLLHKGEQPFEWRSKKKKMLQLISDEIKIAIVMLAKKRLCSVRKKKSSKTVEFG